MKSVIGIVGSPRRGGNTDILVDEVLKGASLKGAKIKKYFLNELNIKGCQGCFACQKDGKCVQSDDMKLIYEDLISEEAFVIGSPIYMNYVTAQTKLFLDRLLPFFKIGVGTRLDKEKKCILVYSQGGGKNGLEIMKGLSLFLEALGIKVLDIIGGNGLNEIGAVKRYEDLLRRAFQCGQKLI
ncbi:MAG: flavodoxin family protein [Synergistetes bacterium]|nr:flavodoxin family protein [Synergistota bacterium]MCX8127653.1 flavodoxin family protein [Synergistota bacterium]MDW8191431.1 flavodoxin family protein [Synergistota bacterium]